MQRVFTKDVGRYKKGMVKNWPMWSWKNVMESGGYKYIKDFSEGTEEAMKKLGDKKARRL